jgi:transposase
MNNYRRKVYTTDLSDVEWAILEPLMLKALNKHDPRGRPLELPLREIVNGVRYVLHNGVQWRDLPSDLPAWSSGVAPVWWTGNSLTSDGAD